MTQQPAFDLWQALAAILPSLGVGAMVGGIIVAFIKRNTDKEANSISEKDVNTRAATMGLEVLTEGLRELRVELVEAKTELKEEKEKGKERDKTLEAQSLQIEAQREKLSEQHDQIVLLTHKVDGLQDQRDAILEHLAILEQGYPNPPGPPQRPKSWGTSLA
jgi:chromosome segregation ATPase